MSILKANEIVEILKDYGIKIDKNSKNLSRFAKDYGIKKADKLEAKFKASLAKVKTMEDLAKGVNSIQMLIPEQQFGNDNIPGIGYDLKVLGTLFGTPANKFSPIIRGDNGVYVVWVTNINKPQEPANYDEQQKMATQQLKTSVDGGVMDALRKKAAIK